MSRIKPLLPYRISICGLGELAEFSQTRFCQVISIIDPDLPDPTVFSSYRPHRRIVYRFDDVVRARVGVAAPSESHVTAILELGDALAREPIDHILVHCHAGVSRSTAAAIILMVQRNPGRESEAFTELRRIRPRSWPNALMIEIADRLLAREGAFMQELRHHQLAIVRDYPDFAQMLMGTERAHEVLALHEDSTL